MLNLLKTSQLQVPNCTQSLALGIQTHLCHFCTRVMDNIENTVYNDLYPHEYNDIVLLVILVS